MNLADTIGNTPLIDLTSALGRNGKVKLYGKAEFLNPGGSIKDRPVKNMITEAVADGRLTKDKTLIDSSSGNAGIAYAMIGSSLGYNVTIVIPGNASKERINRLKAHGANVITTDPLEGYDHAIRHVKTLVEENPEKYFYSNQYANDHNWQAHYNGTAVEIIHQTDKPVTHFIGGVGTGGSITGISRRLKEKYPDISIICIKPDAWPGIEGLKPLGEEKDIVPEIFDESLVDEWVDVDADEAKKWCNKLSRMGIFIGQSSGAYLAGCEKVINQEGTGLFVTLLNDLGERYISTGLWEN